MTSHGHQVGLSGAGHEHARVHEVGDVGGRLGQGDAEVGRALFGLASVVPGADGVARRVQWAGTRQEDQARPGRRGGGVGVLSPVGQGAGSDQFGGHPGSMPADGRV